MTRIQMHFRVREPLDNAALAKLSDASAIYGIQKVKLEADRLMVEYDATRMRPAEVEAALAHAGIAVEPSAA
jgi:hypothetical protein